MNTPLFEGRVLAFNEDPPVRRPSLVFVRQGGGEGTDQLGDFVTLPCTTSSNERAMSNEHPPVRRPHFGF